MRLVSNLALTEYHEALEMQNLKRAPLQDGVRRVHEKFADISSTKRIWGPLVYLFHLIIFNKNVVITGSG
jgi:hypothetical protein